MSPDPVWDEYALRVKPRPPVNGAGDVTWFNWTQYPDHGPGSEVLGIGPDAEVLDLGCGKGDNLAHLSALGARAVGVDVSAFQLADAHRWGDALELHPTDALTYLTGGTGRFDAIYSVFGAVWFTDPALLLPAIRSRLRPGGRTRVLSLPARRAVQRRGGTRGQSDRASLGLQAGPLAADARPARIRRSDGPRAARPDWPV